MNNGFWETSLLNILLSLSNMMHRVVMGEQILFEGV